MRTTKTISMAGIDCVDSRIIANNTFLYHTEDGREITRLHMTDIVTKHPDGRMSLDDGGWKTPTTKARMNDAIAPYFITQDKGKWSLFIRGVPGRLSYMTGLTLEPAVEVTELGDSKAAVRASKKEDRIKKRIDLYLKKLREVYKKDGKFPMPNGGDCWHCLMFDKEGNDNSHIWSHVMESTYIQGSLIANALKNNGHSEESFCIVWNMEDLVIRAVRKFLKSRLGIAR